VAVVLRLGFRHAHGKLPARRGRGQPAAVALVAVPGAVGRGGVRVGVVGDAEAARGLSNGHVEVRAASARGDTGGGDRIGCIVREPDGALFGGGYGLEAVAAGGRGFAWVWMEGDHEAEEGVT
jgi:hypothetical protein